MVVRRSHANSTQHVLVCVVVLPPCCVSVRVLTIGLTDAGEEFVLFPTLPVGSSRMARQHVIAVCGDVHLIFYDFLSLLSGYCLASAYPDVYARKYVSLQVRTLSSWAKFWRFSVWDVRSCPYFINANFEFVILKMYVFLNIQSWNQLK